MSNDYAERYAYRHQRWLAGEMQPPGRISQLSLTAQARLNRVTISRGFVAFWWDSEDKQRELAEAFTPIHRGKFTDRVYPATRLGAAVRRVHATLDRNGHPYFPDISKNESYVESWLNLQCTLAKKLGMTSHLRSLGFIEKSKLLKLHELSRNADVVEINAGR